MKKLFFTLEQYKTQARTLHKNMKEMKLEVSYMQAMQLVAKSAGCTSWELLEKQVQLHPLTFDIASHTEVVLNPKVADNLWITVGNISVYVKANDEGVSVDLYPVNQEDANSLASTYLSYNEAEDDIEDELDDSHFDRLMALSDQIKQEYLESGCDSEDVDYALERLENECGELFPGEHSAWEFLMEEQHDENFSDQTTYAVKVYATEEDFKKLSPEYLDQSLENFEDAKKLADTYSLPFHLITVVECRADDSGDYVYIRDNKTPISKPKV